MSAELRITPIPNAAGLTLQLTGQGLPPAGMLVQRPAPQLDPVLLELFRRTRLTQAQLNDLSNSVTDWLLDPQVRAVLSNALAQNGGLRLVFVVNDEARSIVAQLPLELLWHDAPTRPLVLRKDVQSLVYLLSKARSEPAPATANWPFKALIIRSRPVDLADVPEVAPLADDIRAMGAHYGQGMVQIEVLSSEAAIGKQATWRAIRDHLRTTNDYNILVYLGHGELVASTTGGDPMGQLFMESEDGGGHQPVSAAQLSRLLSEFPVGMVILAGCLTGADGAGTSRSPGGELGVGQALVNSSEAGVQVAVAMRTELQTDVAVAFLRSFFRSLLDVTPDPSGRRPAGDVDRAVRAARGDLYLDADFPPQWAAPIVLRSTEREPFIDFLANPIQFHITQTMQMLLALRAGLWNGMADYSLAEGQPVLLQGRQGPLDDITARLCTEVLLQGPLLLPRDLPIGPGQSAVANVALKGQLAATMLRGRVTVADKEWVEQVRLLPNLAAQFQLLADPQDPGCFELRPRVAGAPAPIPEGDVIEVTIAVPAGTPWGAYPLKMEALETTPASRLWPGDGVVIVPRP